MTPVQMIPTLEFGPILLIAPMLIDLADRAMGLRFHLSGHTLKHLTAGCARRKVALA